MKFFLFIFLFISFFCNAAEKENEQEVRGTSEQIYRMEIEVQDLREELRIDKYKLDIINSTDNLINEAIGRANKSSYPEPLPGMLVEINEMSKNSLDEKNLRIIQKKIRTISGLFMSSVPRIEEMIDTDNDMYVQENKILRPLLAASIDSNYSSNTAALMWRSVFDEEYSSGPLFEKTPDGQKIVTAELKKITTEFSAEEFEKQKKATIKVLGTISAAIQEQRSEISKRISKNRDEINKIAAKIESSRTRKGSMDNALLYGALPALGILMIGLLCAPAIYRDKELHAEVFKSGLLLELFTVLLITSSILILGLGERIDSPILGTLLGGISGYVLGRSGIKTSGSPRPSP